MSSNIDKAIQSDNSLVFSYLALRRAVGVLAAALPVAVSLGAYLINHTGLQSSISGYYYTVTRNVFVGTLWAIGVFLIFYKGYQGADTMASMLGGVFAIGISLFPTAPDIDPTVDAQWIGRIHLAFAASFFITLAYMSLFLFTKTHPDRTKKPTCRKLIRNWFYYVCGVTMLGCILCIGLYFILFNRAGAPFQKYSPVFWLEAIASVAFGISWFIKGETLWKDKVQPEMASSLDTAR